MWAVVHGTEGAPPGDLPEDQHVVPIMDDFPHVLSLCCWCKPHRDAENHSVVVHTSNDGREVHEHRGRKTH